MSTDRIRRRGMLKLVYGGKAYSCNPCNTDFLYVPLLNSIFRI